jgi:hypothetical protein
VELQLICEDVEEREERYKRCAQEDEGGRAAAVKGGGGLPGHVRSGDRTGIAAVATATKGWAVRGLPPSYFASSVWSSRVSPRTLVSVSTYLLATYLPQPPTTHDWYLLLPCPSSALTQEQCHKIYCHPPIRSLHSAFSPNILWSVYVLGR